MKKYQYTIEINAHKKKVWQIMLSPQGYQEWTKPFSEGSYFDGSWQKGEKIKFLLPNGQGTVAEIAENEPYEFVSINHLGTVKEGVEDMESPESKAWAQSKENYSLSEKNGVTKVKIDIETPLNYVDWMENVWHEALAKLKSICE